MCNQHSLRIALAAVVVSTGTIIGAGAAAASAYMSAADSSVTAEALSSAVVGKRDSGLAAVLRRECRPIRLADFTSTFSGMTIPDIFTGQSLTVPSSRPGYRVASIVPSQWWTDQSQGAINIYGDTVSHDLNNRYLMPDAYCSEINGLPPGEPDKVLADHDTWRRGTLNLYGIDVEVWSPFESERGRVARTYMYMALMYPQRSLAPSGMMLMPEDSYAISDYWSRLFLRWSADYPPSRDETEAASIASGAQGGVNPFVLLPGIEQYLWGDKRGEVYGGSSQEDNRPVPLRGTYTSGETIYLTSPHVPADAVWAIDGKRVNDSSHNSAVSAVQAASLSEGQHRLTYTSPATLEKGCVIIHIKL